MAAPDAGPPLDEKEKEVLAYLEDLQANNPGEYELLVQELQAKNKSARPEAEEVNPEPGFVSKTRSLTNGGAKVFINVCQSEHVDKPGQVEMPEGATAEEVQMRIPLSLGQPREDLDKNGSVCTVYDVVFHPEAVQSSLKEAEFRNFVMQLTLHQIQQKYKEEARRRPAAEPSATGATGPPPLSPRPPASSRSDPAAVRPPVGVSRRHLPFPSLPFPSP